MSKTKTKYDSFVVPEIDWSEYEDDRKRIKTLTKKYENVSIAEAFSKEYGVKLDGTSEDYKMSEYSNLNPIAVGSEIDVVVDSISKTDTRVTYHNSKDVLRLKQNITSWNVRPGDSLKVYVAEKGKGEFVVDCVEPLLQNWMNKVSSTLKNTFQSFECTVHDLVRQPGGYTGKVRVPEITALMGKPYEVDAFIPGSYIALNIEKDFEKWNGKTVSAMVTNFTPRGVVCSRKKLLNVAGGTSMVNIYDAGYAHGGQNNVPFTDIIFEGEVTGIINSAKKHGVFVEIPEYSITGLVEKDPADLVNYHIGDEIKVTIDHFDWDAKRGPYRRDRDGILTDVTLRPIFTEQK